MKDKEKKSVKKKGFLAKFFDKLDKKMEEQVKKSSCCSEDDKGNGSSCC